MLKNLTIMLAAIVGTLLPAANLLEDASLQWTGVGHAGAEGTVVKEAGKVRFRKTAADGNFIFFNRKAVPLNPGKSYRVTMKLSGLADRLTTPRLMINFPGYEERKPHDLSAAFSNGVAEIIFTAAERENALRLHFRAGGTGEVILKELTVAEYRPSACYDSENFPRERLKVLRDSLPDEWKNLIQRRDELKRRFSGLNQECDPHFSARIGKRFEITDRLFDFIDGQRRSGDADSLLFAWRGCGDLRRLFDYFEREFRLFEEERRAEAPRILDIRSFGAKGDGVADDAPAFAKALAEASKQGTRTVLRIPAGRYLFRTLSTVKRGDPLPDVIADEGKTAPFWVTLSFHLLLAGQRNLTLQGETGSELWFENPEESGVGIVGCHNVTLRGLTVRYITPTFTQGTILSVDQANNTIVWKADEGFPVFPRKSGCCQTHDPVTGEILPEASGKFLGQVTPLPDGSCRITVKRSFRPTPVWKLEPGQKFIIPFRNNERQGIWLLNSAFCTLREMTIRNSPASGVCSSRGMACNFIDCRIEPQPGAVFSTNADGIHCWNDVIGHYITGCELRNMGDDGFNSCTTGFYVAGEREGDILSMAAIAAGSPLTLISPETGVIRQETMVNRIESYRWNNRTVYRLGIADPVPVGMVSYETLKRNPYSNAEIETKNTGGGELAEEPDVVFDFSACGIGTVITGNRFKSNRNNGIVIQCPNSLIEENTLSLLAIGIRIGSFLTWKEGPPPYNVTLRGNRITRSSCAIQTGYQLRSRKNAECRPLRKLLLQDNTIADCASPLQLANLEGVELAGNQLALPRPDARIRFENIGNLSMNGNRLQDKPWTLEEVRGALPVR